MGNKPIRVQIVNRTHPHYEEYGHFTGQIIRMNMPGHIRMVEVTLENCPHGMASCFVGKGDVRAVE